ncbi:MAG: hypothetical protein JWR66_2051 [Modestobacter sp.]|nr:hypothetical protein [Modestobacter sp.]
MHVAEASDTGSPDRTVVPADPVRRRPRTAQLRALVPGLVVSATLGALYGATMMPGVGGPTDTAKFQYLGSVLGTGHEPGYPLYTMLLAIAVRLVPGVEDALVANALSAVCTVAAAVVFLRVLQRLGVRPTVAVAAALVLGLTRGIWSQAVIAEVYGLNLLLIMGVLLFLVRWRRTSADRDLFLALGVWALSFAHATSAILLAPGVLVLLVLVGRRSLLRPRLLLWLPALAALALLPYGYVLWRTLDPSTVYLEATFQSLPGFVSMVRGETFAAQMFAFPLHELVTTRVGILTDQLQGQPLTWALVPAVLAVATRLREPVVWLLVLWGATVALWGLGYDIPDIEVVFLPGWACLLALAALGAETVLRWIPVDPVRRVLTTATLVVPVVTAVLVLPDVDQSDDPTEQRVTEALAEVGAGGGVVSSYQYHHLNYYLIGPGQVPTPTRDVYSALPMTPEQMAEYCAGTPVGLGWNREVPTAPAGLPLYVFDPPYIGLVAAQGVPLVRVSADLARVDCAALLAAPPG